MKSSVVAGIEAEDLRLLKLLVPGKTFHEFIISDQIDLLSLAVVTKDAIIFDLILSLLAYNPGFGRHYQEGYAMKTYMLFLPRKCQAAVKFSLSRHLDHNWNMLLDLLKEDA